MRRRVFKTLIAMCAVLLILVGGVRMRTLASDSPSGEDRSYISVQIQRGDTLWSVAEEYCGSSSSPDIQNYVSEIRQMNHIEDDTALKAGAYLVVYTLSD